jgi:hypothetical protein
MWSAMFKVWSAMFKDRPMPDTSHHRRMTRYEATAIVVSIVASAVRSGFISV